ncbi:MAG TPA: radical SAM protein [Patescibacteria group bacterium]|jgi:oxygen-independent coproporphyrinogen-3 oxidase|nr:radical SAM protein [Patescibacteria group bacterium]
MPAERLSDMAKSLTNINSAESFMHRKVGEMVIGRLQPVDVKAVLADRDQKRDLGIYVHIPFCTEICSFCAFHREVARPGRQDAYVETLVTHMDDILGGLSTAQPVDSIYFGGGTPGLLRAGEVEKLLSTISQRVDIKDSRVTFELHPQDVNREYIAELSSVGVARFSVGVQNLSDAERSVLNRGLTSANQDIAKLKMLGDMGVVFNVDLMFGTPSQTFRSWGDTLKRLMDEAKPREITLYQYVNAYGASTRIDIERGILARPGIAERHRMYDFAKRTLLEEGYKQTSVLTFSSSPEQRKRKLLNRGRDFIGLGPRTYSKIGRHFFINDANTVDFVEGRDNARFYGFTAPDWFSRISETASVPTVNSSRAKDVLGSWESETIAQAYGVLYYILNQQRIYRRTKS